MFHQGQQFNEVFYIWPTFTGLHYLWGIPCPVEHSYVKGWPQIGQIWTRRAKIYWKLILKIPRFGGNLSQTWHPWLNRSSRFKVYCTVNRFGPKVGHIGPKWDKPGKFSDQIQYILARLYGAWKSGMAHLPTWRPPWGHISFAHIASSCEDSLGMY